MPVDRGLMKCIAGEYKKTIPYVKIPAVFATGILIVGLSGENLERYLH